MMARCAVTGHALPNRPRLQGRSPCGVAWRGASARQWGAGAAPPAAAPRRRTQPQLRAVVQAMYALHQRATRPVRALVRGNRARSGVASD